jgi:two-component system response regulator YesN
MTAFPQIDYILKGVECKITAFLIKPIHREKLNHELLKAVKEIKNEQKKQLDLRQHSYIYFRMLDNYLSLKSCDMSYDVIREHTGINQITTQYLSVLVIEKYETDGIHDCLQTLSKQLDNDGMPNVYYISGSEMPVFLIGHENKLTKSEIIHISSKISHSLKTYSAGISFQDRKTESIRKIYQQAIFALEYGKRLRVDNTIVLFNSINLLSAILLKHKDTIYEAFLDNNTVLLEKALNILFIELSNHKISPADAYHQWCLLYCNTELEPHQLQLSMNSLNHLRAMILKQLIDKMGDSSEIPEKVTQIINYVRDNYYNKQINLAYISNYLNIGYSYASSIFKKYTGISFSKYLLNYRMTKAAEILENTNCYIYEVADKVGLDEYNKSFFHSFKNMFGLTPQEYRDKK